MTRILFTLCFAVVLLAAPCRLPAAATAEAPLQPYLQNPAADAVSILWQTPWPAYGWVEYGDTPALGKTQDWVIDGLRHANATEHRVRLSDLEPGKPVYYRVGVKEIKTLEPYKVVFGEPQYSATCSFTPPPAHRPEATCCFFNDLHNNPKSFESLLGSLRQATPDAVFFNGDCFVDLTRAAQFPDLLRMYGAGVDAAQRPVYFVRGNHEMRGPLSRLSSPFFETPSPDGKPYFAVTVGPVRFIVLDCGEDKPDTSKEYFGLIDLGQYRRDQADWLRRELRSKPFKEARYRVLVHHIPLYGENRSRPSRALWEPVLKGAPIDLAICGHTHQFELIEKNKAGNPYPVLIGGSPEKPTLITLRADKRECVVEMTDAKGTKLESVTIEPRKPKLARLWQWMLPNR